MKQKIEGVEEKLNEIKTEFEEMRTTSSEEPWVLSDRESVEIREWYEEKIVECCETVAKNTIDRLRENLKTWCVILPDGTIIVPSGNNKQKIKSLNNL